MQYEDDDVESALISLSTQLSASPLDESGAVRFLSEDRELGFVLMERGSVCFATALGQHGRLTELMVAHHGVGSNELEAVWKQCRSEGQPIADALSEHNLLTPSALEEVLLQHTAESLGKIAALGPVYTTWEPHQGSGYQAQFHFALPRVVARALSLHIHADVVALEARLLRLIDPHVLAITFSRSGSLPLAVAGEVTLDLSEIQQVGALARALQTRLAVTRPAVISAATDHGTLLTFVRDGLCTVVLSTQPSSTARLLGRFMRGDYGDL